MLINLKPLKERKVSASDVIRRLQPELEKVQDITLYMQSVQDLTVEDRVSRTQFQYTLEDANADELNTWTKKLVDELRSLPQLTDVATDQQTRGSQAKLVIDRVTASRLGITPLAIDDDLPKIPSVVKDFQFFAQPKYRIASSRPGSGNTKNIGSVIKIEELV